MSVAQEGNAQENAAGPDDGRLLGAEQAIRMRGELTHCRQRWTETGRGTVAFLGGSITEMQGYRPLVMASLRQRFPEVEFQFVNAGIASTCSHTGAFRLHHDVLSAKPDLLFVEFAVNDDQDAGHSYQDAVRGMEGIVRAAKSVEPTMDLVMIHFVNESMLETVQAGGVPISIRAHESVAKHYGISTCNVAEALASRIQAGTMTWKDYGGVHPGAAGNRLAADLVDQLLDRAWSKDIATPTDTADPSNAADPLPEPLDVANFDHGRFLSPDQIDLGPGWQHEVPAWKSVAGSLRSRFENQPLTYSDQPGAELRIDFSGSAVGLYVLAGPDAGQVQYSIDDGPWQTLDLYHRFSLGLHYPRTVVLGAGLERGEHQVRVRVGSQHDPRSRGTAVRVVQFVAS
ncbi:SGNH/GDSL hydrolase family protein [Roseiconus nitratireducens]|uniref:SGNH/GDSL hydrolase family protein n=1 Tax=Roseiconus nitratireducens TaxID=2605748 RepID=UPI001376051C|nr:GDSL-type esterase/lipase family protein [Roseiconus nitratireducens]